MNTNTTPTAFERLQDPVAQDAVQRLARAVTRTEYGIQGESPQFLHNLREAIACAYLDGLEEGRAQERAKNDLASAKSGLSGAQEAARWRKVLEDTGSLEDVSDDALAAAGATVEAARAAETIAKDVAKRSTVLAEAEVHATESARLQKRADLARQSSNAFEEALSKAIEERAPCAMSVRGGRLVVAHATRGTVPVSELSTGELCRIAMDVALETLDTQGTGRAVLPMEQELWESLDPTNRAAVAQHAKERGIVILAAEAADGDLRAEQFEGATREG